ncbi:DUF2069 domain-containing protein [Endothiovibrio diazotrophicus]
MSRQTVTFRWLALAGYFGLLALMMAWPTLLAPPEKVPVAVVLLITAGPLLFPLRGLLHGRPSSHLWAALLTLPYMTHALVELYSNPPGRLLAGLELVLVMELFVGAVLFAKHRGRELKEKGEG